MQVVNHDLVATVRAKRREDGLGDSLAGFNVADDRTVFGIMTMKGIMLVNEWNNLSIVRDCRCLI